MAKTLSTPLVKSVMMPAKSLGRHGIDESFCRKAADALFGVALPGEVGVVVRPQLFQPCLKQMIQQEEVPVQRDVKLSSR